jgi:hypothetical protein
VSLTARSLAVAVAVAAAAFGVAFLVGSAASDSEAGAVEVPKLELPSAAPEVKALGAPAVVPSLRPAPAASSGESDESAAPAPEPAPAPAPEPAPAPADGGDTIIEG